MYAVKKTIDLFKLKISFNFLFFFIFYLLCLCRNLMKLFFSSIKYQFVWLLSLGVIFFSSCKKHDEETLIGKWECDQEWFEFFPDNTYNGGKSIITEFKKYKYIMSPSEHALNLYTNDGSHTFYCTYEFKGKDTLALINSLDKRKIPAIYIRTKKEQP
jgi:hypothetical protein